MVLHNSKWDKKATRAYNKKHGIVTQKAPKSKTDEWKAKPLEGNLWRYQPEDSDEEAKREVNELLENEGEVKEDGDNDDQEEKGGTEDVEEKEGTDHTLRQAAVQLVSERPTQLASDYYMPPDEYSEDEELNAVIRSHKPTGELKRQTKVLKNNDREEFDRIQNDIDRHKFYSDVKRRFGGTKNTGSRLDDEEDIDKFLDDIDQLDIDDDDRTTGTAHSKAASKLSDFGSKADFLDNLLG